MKMTKSRLATILSAVLMSVVLSHTLAAAPPERSLNPPNRDRARLNDERAIRAAVLQYLHDRFDSRLMARPYSLSTQPATVAQVEGTALAIAFDRWQANIAEMSGGWADYQLRSRFSDVAVTDNDARATVTLDVDYHYAMAPDVDSSVYGVVYQFELTNRNRAWSIVAIDADEDDYQRFKADVAELTKLGLSGRDAAQQLVDERAIDAAVLREQMQSTPVPVEEMNAPVHALVNGTFSYNGGNGAEYARRFGSSGTPGTWFYTATNNDCTNFVSQSVWAAYGGYVSGNDTLSKQNIANKVRMVPTIWQAGTGGGTPNWEQVDKFWNYATSSKTTGPNATGYNNNAKVATLSPTSIKVGDVLQFRNSSISTNPYQHSVYVSLVMQGPPLPGQSYWDLIYVSYHSSNNSSKKLTDVINGFGGTFCNLRRLAFSSASLAK